MIDLEAIHDVKCYCGKCGGTFQALDGVRFDAGAEVRFVLPILSSHAEGRPEHRNGVYDLAVKA